MHLSTKFIAHVRKIDDDNWDTPQLLFDHLEGTARLAEANAMKFHSREWGKVAGLAHDAGKGRLEWQKYIREKSGFGFHVDAHMEGKAGKIPHAIHGAKLVEFLFGKGIGRILAYPIAGHHAGLPDWSSAEGAGRSSLKYQESQVENLDDVDKGIVEKVRAAKPGSPPWKFSKGLDISLWIRMLYSCLVDADFLDTESYMNPESSANRSDYCTIPELLERFKEFAQKMDNDSDKTRVNEIRREIRAKCIRLASEDQGIFSLTVPTGGGKTLSSLAFALEHAVKHCLDRVIYVIPYTSIIEQNADVFHVVLGEDEVVEHHSSLDEDETTSRARLASENWDAPVIVTTSVQFFESLFAAKSSRCRKLHNIARSVVVLDEAQLVPVEYLDPILETLQLLVDRYQVSLVISTATQPAFKERLVDGKRFEGLRNITEIMGDDREVQSLYESLKRYEVEFPPDFTTISSWQDIATELSQYEQVLCVVSDRKSCRELHSLMPEGTYHLSALMCGQHRSAVISEIKQELKQNHTVRVISTQLVEAGVDLDFPVVYRALAGLDSISQAAGRCNREGKLEGLGKVVVFNPRKQAPPGLLRKAADTARTIIATAVQDPLQCGVFEKYFNELYWKANSLDAEGIKCLLDPNDPQNDPKECGMSFRTAAERFQIIDESQVRTILVRFGEGERLIDLLKSTGPDRWLMRKLQRYTVNVYSYDFTKLLQRGAIEEVYPGIFVLSTNLDYSDTIGLLVEETSYDPEKFIL